MNRLFNLKKNISDDLQNENTIVEEKINSSFSGIVPDSINDISNNVPHNTIDIIKKNFWNFLDNSKKNIEFFLSLLLGDAVTLASSYNNLPYENRHLLKGETAEDRLNRWKYNSSLPLFITLPGVFGPVMNPLPHPLWSIGISNELSHQNIFSERVADYLLDINENLCSLCTSAGDSYSIGIDNIDCKRNCADNRITGCDSSLILLKYLVDFSARPLELMVSAMCMDMDMIG